MIFPVESFDAADTAAATHRLVPLLVVVLVGVLGGTTDLMLPVAEAH